MGAAVAITKAAIPEPAGELADLRFRALLPAEAWANLPLAVRRRFSKRMTGGTTVTYCGAVPEVHANVAGRMLALAARLIGGPLPLVFEPGASVVTVLGLRLRLPRWAEPGRLTIVHRDLGEGAFAFTLALDHPWLGRLIGQNAIFKDA